MLNPMRIPSNLPLPTRALGDHGIDLWNAIQSDYLIEDGAEIEVLMEACQALDRAESLAAQIAADGPVIHSASGPRVHPCISQETNARALVVRCLTRLGVLHEPIRPVGGAPGPKSKRKEPPNGDE